VRSVCAPSRAARAQSKAWYFLAPERGARWQPTQPGLLHMSDDFKTRSDAGLATQPASATGLLTGCVAMAEGGGVSMATPGAVNSGSKFCRDCGGPVTTRGGFQWCENTDPKPKCELLPRTRRNFCEWCGEPVKLPVCFSVTCGGRLPQFRNCSQSQTIWLGV
jgi:hypothetical protein